MYLVCGVEFVGAPSICAALAIRLVAVSCPARTGPYLPQLLQRDGTSSKLKAELPGGRRVGGWR
jgi:hypothetical protein